MSNSFAPVDPQVNFPEMERKILAWWYESGIVTKYLRRNAGANKKFSFLDGPITANNPMGVHHAWGRTYKDLWQRYFTMRGFRERFQNGFDCQGLWVEVEVEKELGFKTKKDIEFYGVANFVNKCKERVRKYAAIQTEQTKRLGNFMDWDNSYYTMSDENNYAIWHFLKVCWDRGWLYKGHDSVPWCLRCETAISQHEMLTEDYKELTHETVFVKLPITTPGWEKTSLLVWTTTPWTVPGNVAVGVNVKFTYAPWENKNTGEKILVVHTDANDQFPKRVIGNKGQTVAEFVFGDQVTLYELDGTKKGGKFYKGSDLLGLKYSAPFDNLPRVQKSRAASPKNFHTVVDGSEIVVSGEGTGMLHIAPGAGKEDFDLGKKKGLPVISLISDNADYLDGLGEFTGKNAKKHPELIIDFLKEYENGKFLLKTMPFTHRYPACWRCKTELVWKVADEWYIAMDKKDPTDGRKRTLRQQMVDVAKEIHWLPEFGLDRELDWLKNMHDWLISKKNRYWGLALPIYECDHCGHFEVLGSKGELKERAISGWELFHGNSPHRPWIDKVHIACSKCRSSVSRVKDVGNPWLDAGIVPFSTLPTDWFPADFITESFPGQFKNWFYSLIAMATVLAKVNPFKTVLGFALACGVDGEIMHKSNPKTYISFDEGADKAGVDVMRWMFVSQNPTQNLLFGWEVADTTRRRFHLIYWNIYNFFVTYANADHINGSISKKPLKAENVLDRWILSRLHSTTAVVTGALDRYDAFSASQALEDLILDASLWYVRRSRDRVGLSAIDRTDKIHTYETLHCFLVTTARLLAPFIPFISEAVFQNLTGGESVHLAAWPKMEGKLIAPQLEKEMEAVRQICERGNAIRKGLGIKTKQPLQKFTIYNAQFSIAKEMEQLIRDELNVKEVELLMGNGELRGELDTTLTPKLIAEGKAREIIREIQQARKQSNVPINHQIKVTLPDGWPKEFEAKIKAETLAVSLESGSSLSITFAD